MATIRVLTQSRDYNGTGCVELSCPFKAEQLPILRGLPGAKFHRGLKLWTFKRSRRVMDTLAMLFPEVTPQ